MQDRHSVPGRREDLAGAWGSEEQAAINEAIRRGAEFLSRARREAGGELFRDYLRPDGSGGSTEWVSAFVVAQIACVEEARSFCADTVRQLLLRARPTGGWGYREEVLEDCDSTAWVLLAASRAGIQVPRQLGIAAVRFVLSHQTPEGGFTTYGTRGREIFGHVSERRGWFEPQLCVTAAALLALKAAGLGTSEKARLAERFVMDQREQGLWRAYWWPGHAYATYHALAALDGCEEWLEEDRYRASAALLETRCEDRAWGSSPTGPSTPFSTGLSLLALLLGPEQAGAVNVSTALRLGARRLLDLQRDDGAFDGSAELIVPGGYKGELLSMTDSGVFTSACALRALHGFRAYCRQTRQGN